MDDNELIHYGTKGMQWGVRRYQNKDGTLTNAGKKRYNAELGQLRSERKILKNQQETKAKIKKLKDMRDDLEAQKAEVKKPLSEPKLPKDPPKKKTISEMSNEELRSALERIDLEKRYAAVTNSLEVKKGKSFVNTAIDKVVIPAITEASKEVMKNTIKSAMTKAIKDTFDLDVSDRKKDNNKD